MPAWGPYASGPTLPLALELLIYVFFLLFRFRGFRVSGLESGFSLCVIEEGVVKASGGRTSVTPDVALRQCHGRTVGRARSFQELNCGLVGWPFK